MLHKHSKLAILALFLTLYALLAMIVKYGSAMSVVVPGIVVMFISNVNNVLSSFG